MRHHLTLALALTLVVALPFGVRAQQTLLRPSSLPFNERLTERVPVSGRPLVGLLRTVDDALPSGLGLRDGSISIDADERTDGVFCVRAVTQDGRYYAENAYGRPAPDAGAPLNPGMAPLAWPSVHSADLARLPLREVAVLTTIGSCDRAKAVVPSSVGAPSASGASFLQVLANTRGAATWAVLRDPVARGPALVRVRCVRLTSGARVAFDVVCPVGRPPAKPRLELRLEQQGRDGSSVEIVEDVEIVFRRQAQAGR